MNKRKLILIVISIIAVVLVIMLVKIPQSKKTDNLGKSKIIENVKDSGVKSENTLNITKNTSTPKPNPSPSTTKTNENTGTSKIDADKKLILDTIIGKEINNYQHSVSYGAVEEYSVEVKSLKSGATNTVVSKKMLSASMIKVFIMVEAFNRIKAGTLKLDDKITYAGTKKTIKELIDLMITVSDNTATNLLIDKLTMANINKTIKNFGCKDTSLQRKMLDFDSIKLGKDNFTSANDLALIFEKMYKGQCLGQEYDKKMLDILKLQEVNTKIPKLLPKGTVIAHKTGELDNVENDGGIIYTDKGDYIICVLFNNVQNPSKVRDLISRISKDVFDNINK
jgi:beta-lactamase class A